MALGCKTQFRAHLDFNFAINLRGTETEINSIPITEKCWMFSAAVMLGLMLDNTPTGHFCTESYTVSSWHQVPQHHLHHLMVWWSPWLPTAVQWLTIQQLRVQSELLGPKRKKQFAWMWRRWLHGCLVLLHLSGLVWFLFGEHDSTTVSRYETLYNQTL